MATLPAFALFFGHALLFGSWIVDDAGITFAYARNLADGDGLVAHPAAEPVEGFSNALWTLLLAATRAVDLFDPAATPKLAGGALVWVAFLLLSLSLVAGYRRSAAAVGLALATAAASTPFVVWSVSGLENGLSVCLVSALVAVSLRTTRRRRVEKRDAVLFGVLCFLLFLTRPDGIVLLPLAALLMGISAKEPSRKTAEVHSLAFLGPWILATGCRLIYFGDVLPNTYYAKKGPGWQQTLWLIDTLGIALGGVIFIAVVAGVVVASVRLAAVLGERLRKLPDRFSVSVVLGSFFVTGYLVFETLPTDWMPEYRFGTTLFLLGPLLLVEVLGRLPRRWRKGGMLAGAAVIFGAACLYSSVHSLAFRWQPTVPFAEVRELSAKIELYARSLGVDRATVLLPDIGGSLWEDRFEVIDLAGLTDRTIGRTLRSDRGAFLEYVLNRGPDLVWVHGYWQKLTGFEQAGSFMSHYTAVPAGPVLGREDGVLYVKSSLLDVAVGDRLRPEGGRG